MIIQQDQSNQYIEQKVLFIFGAGASKADCAPLQNELIFEILNVLENNQQNTDLNQRFVNNMKNFLYKLYPINKELGNRIYPTLEEVMGLIHFAIVRDESFKGVPYIELKDYLESLIALIAYILHTKLMKSKKVSREFIKCLYNSFKERNAEKDKIELIKLFSKKFSFLNINYDILLDNALSDLKKDYSINYDYCFNINGFSGLKLFKPHGSLNWLLCKSCGKIITGIYEKLALSYYDSILRSEKHIIYCKCGGIYSPLIVPPSFFKEELNNQIIRNILINLERHLKTINTLIFVGYSFPEADLHLKYLFKKAQLLGDFRKIILINKRDENNWYYINVKRTFPGLDLIDLTNEFPDGLKDTSVKKIIDRLQNIL